VRGKGDLSGSVKLRNHLAEYDKIK
jgi:hypothetical protein